MLNRPHQRIALGALHVFDQYKLGGFESHLDVLLKYLSLDGLRLFCASGPEFSKSSSRHLVSRAEQLDLSGTTASALSSCVDSLQSVIETDAVDVVHAHTYLSAIPAALAAAKTARPLMLTFHGIPEVDDLVQYLGIFNFELLQNFVLPYCHAVTAVSSAGLITIRDALGIEGSSVTIVANPIDLDEFAFSAPPRKKTGLLVSRLDRDKEVSCLAALDLFEAMRRVDSGWQFVVAGDGELASSLRTYAESGGISDIVWLGATTGIGDLMKASRFVVGQSRVVLEALAAGRVAVLSGNNGLAGVVTPANVERFQSDNFTANDARSVLPQELAQRLLKCLSGSGHPYEKLHKLVEECYGAQSITANYKRHYIDAASAAPPSISAIRAAELIGWLEKHPDFDLRKSDWITDLSRAPSWLFGSSARGAAFRRLRIDTLSEESFHYIELQNVRNQEVQDLTTNIDELVRDKRDALARQDSLLLQMKELQSALQEKEDLARSLQEVKDESEDRDRQAIARLQAELAASSHELDTSREKLREMEERLNQESDSVNLMLKQLDGTASELDRLRSAHEQALRERNRADEAVASLSTQVADFQRHVDHLRQLLEQSRSINNQAVADVSNLRGQVSALQIQVEQSRREALDTKEESRRLRKHRDHLLEANRALKEQVHLARQQAKVSISELTRKTSIAQAETRTLRATVRELQEKATRLQADHRCHIARLASAEEKAKDALGVTTRRLEDLQEQNADLKMRIQQLETTVQAARTEAARLKDEYDSQGARLRQIEEHSYAERKEAESHILRLREDSADLQASLAQVRAELEAVTVENTALRNERDDQAGKADTRQRALSSLHSGVRAFQEEFERKLEAYRGQRAWKVMLAIRMVYTLVVRQGWSGCINLLRWPFLTRGERKTPSDYELEFPNPSEYVTESRSQESRTYTEYTVKSELDSSANHLYDLIVLPIFDFEFRFQRPQHIATEYARAGHRVFWVSPSRFLTPDSASPVEIIPLRRNLFEVRLRRSAFNLYLDNLSDDTIREIIGGLEYLWRECAVAESAVLIQFPSWRKVGLALRERFNAVLAYDLMDDWRNWPTEPKPSRFSIDEEVQLAGECDILTVTAAKFAERYRDNIPAPLLIPNGADFEFFSTCRKNARLLAHLTKPIVGYYGAISQWFDADLMFEVAKRRPQYSFVLIGQVHDCDVTRLRALPNVEFLGEKRYAELPALLAEFDVCLIPFLLNDLTDAVDPVKVYEYFSQGAPVVATRLPELLKRGDLLYFGGSPEEFASGLDQAVQECDKDLRERRIAYAEQNRWKSRYDVLNNAVSEKFPLVSIVVVTHNSAEYLTAFVDSLIRNTTYPNVEVVIWDNASSDNSAVALRQLADKHNKIKLHLSDTNYGFAGGNNRAVFEARGEYIIIINPDTIVTLGWVERLLRPVRRDERVGMTAPVTNFSGNETRIDTSYQDYRGMEEFALDLAKVNFEKTLDLSCAPLLCVLLRRQVWQELEGLDERFEVGMFEDDDFCLRMKNAGYVILNIEDCFIHHFGNGSFGKLSSLTADSIFAENRSRFERKWGMAWRPHTSRPGVKPLESQARLPVALFMSPDRLTSLNSAMTLPAINRILPQQCKEGESVNVQPDGRSAIVIECVNATPGTMILWGDQLLETAYGSSCLLSGVLPAGFNANAAEVEVRLVNDFGMSDPQVFTVGLT